MNMSRQLIAAISQKALKHNVATIKSKIKQAKMIAMIKANAYGHGLNLVAKTIENEVDAFGVACIDEALLLRQNNIQKPIVLMEGIFFAEELPLVQQHNLIVVLHAPYQIEAILKNKELFAQKKIQVWIKIDTGMHRLGFTPNQFFDVYDTINRAPFIELLGFMTHFPQADDIDNPSTRLQTELFQTLIKGLPGLKSLANSAALLSLESTHADVCRPGLVLYGASPFKNTVALDHGFKPVMNLYSQVIAKRIVKRGQAVGYGGTWVASEDTEVGTIAFGYGDGYPWHAKNGTPVLINGQRVPLVGRVSMDMIEVNLTGLDVKEGTQVLLWGEGLPIEEIAQHAATIPYELFCRLTQRVTTKLVD